LAEDRLAAGVGSGGSVGDLIHRWMFVAGAARIGRV
jgi:hypothetical protein